MAPKSAPPERPKAKTPHKPAKPAIAGAKPGTAKTGTDKTGERIAKVMARAGVASRREAEKLIELGPVAVNGVVIDSPALNVAEADKITK